jgi:hypothetical protein
MQFSLYVHEQAVRDRREALLRAAAAHRLAGRKPLIHRLRCRVARLGVPAVSPDGCDGRPALAGSA